MSSTASPLFGRRGSEGEIEEGTAFAPKLDADGLIPVVATDAETGEVLMFAWMNAEALEKTILTGDAWYWSRSRKELWRKGETSGQTQTVLDMRTDCDQDAIWLKVKVGGDGGACHVGYRSCFYRSLSVDSAEKPALLRFVGEKLPGHEHN